MSNRHGAGAPKPKKKYTPKSVTVVRWHFIIPFSYLYIINGLKLN
jgi:hypothetical protein